MAVFANAVLSFIRLQGNQIFSEILRPFAIAFFRGMEPVDGKIFRDHLPFGIGARAPRSAHRILPLRLRMRERMPKYPVERRRECRNALHVQNPGPDDGCRRKPCLQGVQQCSEILAEGSAAVPVLGVIGADIETDEIIGLRLKIGHNEIAQLVRGGAVIAGDAQQYGPSGQVGQHFRQLSAKGMGDIAYAHPCGG